MSDTGEQRPAITTSTSRTQTAQPAAPSTDELVDAWFNECIRNTAIAKNTDTWNAAYQACAELKRRLARK